MKEKTEQKREELYEAPMVEVTEVVIEQNILQAASDNSPDDIPGEYW